ncbi:peptidoglycan-binding protein [Candidatus Halocynthiibacter alkanivorans]|uniref:peptidoglycan-binding protein n=1 Tax=Candidatus Halocynthiibacter alkanivorans TaxID=2267619 RepID=UPI000DF1A14B|nr:peptidoglycan-binding protein [Candidatus Halocynthiibacter alkanivorans]
MRVSTAQLALIAGTARETANMASVIAGLEAYGYVKLGLERPDRLAQYIPQIAHESGRFRYDKEIWGPTPAQARYDTRTDLGNSPAQDGDGRLYSGRSGIQVTGRANYALFTAWAQAKIPDAPDFVASPDLLNTDPWEGLAPLWYWERRKLNRYADRGDIEMVTRRINGGLNGYRDRLELYARTALVFLGYDPGDVHAFQLDAGLDADGVSGPQTRAAFHAALRDHGFVKGAA